MDSTIPAIEITQIIIWMKITTRVINSNEFNCKIIFLLLAIQEVYINNCKNNIYRKKFISGINETNFQFLLYTFSHNTR